MKDPTEAFIEKNGTVEDWGGDRNGWLQALGAFSQGWYAHIEAVEQCLQPTDGAGSDKPALSQPYTFTGYDPNLGKTISG